MSGFGFGSGRSASRSTFGGGSFGGSALSSSTFGGSSSFGSGFGSSTTNTWGNANAADRGGFSSFSFGNGYPASDEILLGSRRLKLIFQSNWGDTSIVAETIDHPKWKFKASNVTGAQMGMPNLSADQVGEFVKAAIIPGQDLNYCAGVLTTDTIVPSPDSIQSLAALKQTMRTEPFPFRAINEHVLVIYIEIVNKWKSQFAVLSLQGCAPEPSSVSWGSGLDMKEQEPSIDQLANDVREMHAALREMQQTVTRLIGTVRNIANSQGSNGNAGQSSTSSRPSTASTRRNAAQKSGKASSGFSFGSQSGSSQFSPDFRFGQPSSTSTFSFGSSSTKKSNDSFSFGVSTGGFSNSSSGGAPGFSKSSFGSSTPVFQKNNNNNTMKNQSTSTTSLNNGGVIRPTSPLQMAFQNFDNHFEQYNQLTVLEDDDLALIEERPRRSKSKGKNKKQKKSKNKNKTYTCDDCMREFGTQSALKVHSKVHMKPVVLETPPELVLLKTEDEVPKKSKTWFYIDHADAIQGPFPPGVMQKWFNQKFITDDLRVCESRDGLYRTIADHFRDGNAIFMDSVPSVPNLNPDAVPSPRERTPTPTNEPGATTITITKSDPTVMENAAEVDIHFADRDEYRVYQANGCVYSVVLSQVSTVSADGDKFYVLQVLTNDLGNWVTFFRWGRSLALGPGQQQVVRHSTAEAAIADFKKKFLQKTKNEWENRQNFEPQVNKYQISKSWRSASGAPKTSEVSTETGALGFQF